MAWDLSFAKPGLTTQNMHIVATNIAKDQLQNGDALNCDSRHIVIFGGWTDSSKTHYWAYESANPNTGTIKSATPTGTTMYASTLLNITMFVDLHLN